MAGQRNRTWAVIGGLALIAAGALAFTTPHDQSHFVSVPRPGAAAKTSHRATTNTAKAQSPAGAPTGLAGHASGVQMALAPRTDEAAAKAAAPGEAPVAASRSAVANRDLFKPLVTKTVKGLAPSSLPPMPAGLDSMLPLPDMSLPTTRNGSGHRQRAYWEYVGTVRLSNVTYALIEERKSKTGTYLRVGDKFRGGRVQLVRPEYVVISLAGRRYTIPKSTGMNDTSVQVAAAAPAPANTPVTGQPAAQPTAPGANPTPDATRAASPDPNAAQQGAATDDQSSRQMRRRYWRRYSGDGG